MGGGGGGYIPPIPPPGSLPGGKFMVVEFYSRLIFKIVLESRRVSRDTKFTKNYFGLN